MLINLTYNNNANDHKPEKKKMFTKVINLNSQMSSVVKKQK